MVIKLNSFCGNNIWTKFCQHHLRKSIKRVLISDSSTLHYKNNFFFILCTNMHVKENNSQIQWVFTMVWEPHKKKTIGNIVSYNPDISVTNAKKMLNKRRPESNITVYGSKILYTLYIIRSHCFRQWTKIWTWNIFSTRAILQTIARKLIWNNYLMMNSNSGQN